MEGFEQPRRWSQCGDRAPFGPLRTLGRVHDYPFWSLHVLKPKVVIVAVFLVVVLPLWIAFAWTLGLIRIGTEPVIVGVAPVFEQSTARDRDELSFCLGKNYSGRLTLIGTNSPPQPPQTTRFRNRASHMVVDVSAQSPSGSVVRVFKLNGAPLAPVHRLAIQSCIPENGFPAAGDPRNRELYSGGE